MTSLASWKYLVKGYANPEDYFNLFRNSLLIGKESHIWFRDKVVTLFDDHDQIRKGDSKARFCALGENWKKVVLNALALNAVTWGYLASTTGRSNVLTQWGQ